MAINAGELKDSLKILAKIGNTIDENGFAVDDYQELFKLRCKKKTVSTKEFNESNKDSSELTYKFICRNRDIDNQMLIEYANKTFNIKHVHEIDDFFIEITASETKR
jgi:SPP1 family predicted phage head-tail adaptor